MAHNPVSDELHEEIVFSFERHLRAQGNTALGVPGARKQMLDQVRSILDEVVDCCRRPTENIDNAAVSESAGISVGPTVEGMYPAESLHTASVLFEAALPVVSRAFSAIGRPDAGARAALVLHRVIMRRIVSSAMPLPGSILRAIRDSHRAELARLARELHDRTAHSIGVAIQDLELYEVHASRDRTRAREKIDLAREAMLQALDSVRHFSAELRMTVRPDELERTLTEYLATNARGTVLTSVKITGDTARLPEEVCEEVYVTLREAIRNALVHSGTTRLDVTIGISESRLTARVSDTGRGFSIEEATKAGEGIGLASMRERMHLLGGVLRLSSLPGEGTTVEISIPLGRAIL